MTYEERSREIATAYAEAGLTVPYVDVIPVRMTEAWMLHDQDAIKLAADNPSGKVTLSLPALKRVHLLPDPKAELEKLLINASELSKRRLKKFKARQRMHRLAELIEDFAPLREQASFRRLEQQIIELREVLTTS